MSTHLGFDLTRLLSFLFSRTVLPLDVLDFSILAFILDLSAETDKTEIEVGDFFSFSSYLCCSNDKRALLFIS